MIENIGAISSITSNNNELSVDKTVSIDFSQLLIDKVDNVNNSIDVAESILESFAKGNDIPIHEAMIAMQKAKTNITMLVEARNKVLEAYQEVLRMQI